MKSYEFELLNNADNFRAYCVSFMGFFSSNISNKITRGIKAVIKTGALYGVYATVTNEFIDFYCVKDVSMQPTLSEGNILIVKPVGPRSHNPLVDFGIINPPWIHFEEISRGDIVVAKDPTDPNTFICKRVTGLKGDYIPLEHRVLNRHVPEGCAWVEGDYKENSRDSRNYGPVPLGNNCNITS